MNIACVQPRETSAPGVVNEGPPARRRALQAVAPVPAREVSARGGERSAVWTPEHHLVAAVLEDAVRCIRRGPSRTDARRTRVFDEALAWLRSTEASTPFSCEHVCDVLGIDADAVRRALGLAAAHPSSARTPVPSFPRHAHAVAS